MRLAERLLDHEEELHDNYNGARARLPLSYKAHGDITSLEFCGSQREDASMRLWAGTSTGVVSLLSAQRYDFESDGQGRHLEAWQVTLPCIHSTCKCNLHFRLVDACTHRAWPSKCSIDDAGMDG